jgi:hypothetical protein
MQCSSLRLRNVRQTARLRFSSAYVMIERPTYEHATGAVLAASELAHIVEWTRPFWFGAGLGHFVCRWHRKSAFNLLTKLRRSAVKSESGECITMYNPADVAVTFEQAEGGAFLCGGDICNVRVKQ